MKKMNMLIPTALAAILSMAVSRPAAAQDSSLTFFGITASPGTYQETGDSLAALGLDWITITADSAADSALLSGIPRGHRFILRLYDPSLAADLPAWQTYVREAVQKFGPGGTFWTANPALSPVPVRYYQVWDKPNLNAFLPVSGNTWRDELYMDLLRAAYGEIKAVGSGLQVIGMNVAHAAANSQVPPLQFGSGTDDWGFLAFIKAVNQRGAADYCDIIGLQPHTYCGSPCGSDTLLIRSPESGEMIAGITELKYHLNTIGKSAQPLWISEAGYPRYHNGQEILTEHEQAAWLVRMHVLAAAQGITHVTSFAAADPAAGPDSLHGYGLYAGSASRAQARALGNLITLLPDPDIRYAGIVDTAGSHHAYLFTCPDGRDITVYWTTGDSVRMTFPAGGYKAELTGLYGTTDHLENGDTITVPASDAPRFFTVYRSPDGTAGTISGTISDGNTGLALPGVMVRAEGSAAVTHVLTGTGGTYSLPGLPPDEYTLGISRSAYTDTTLDRIRISGQGKDVTVNIEMTEQDTLPVIGALHLVKSTPQSATWFCAADKPVSLSAAYGVSPTPVGFSVQDSVFGFNKIITLTGLTPDQAYTVRFTAEDRFGNTVQPADEDVIARTAFHDDFEWADYIFNKNWQVTDTAYWRIGRDTDRALELHLRPRASSSPSRPGQYALVRDPGFGDFDFRCRARSTYFDKDLCFIFGYQDDTHFYYVLLSGRQANFNRVYLVNGTSSTILTQGDTTLIGYSVRPHDIRITRNAQNGNIRVYVDDMTAPALEADDTTFRSGKIGVASYGGTGYFDDISIAGAVEPVSIHAELPTGIPGGGLSLFPSPASGTVTITLPDAGNPEKPSEIIIRDRRGMVTKRIVGAPGSPTLVWDGRDLTGSRAETGMYFVTCETGGIISARRVMIIRPE